MGAWARLGFQACSLSTATRGGCAVYCGSPGVSGRPRATRIVTSSRRAIPLASSTAASSCKCRATSLFRSVNSGPPGVYVGCISTSLAVARHQPWVKFGAEVVLPLHPNKPISTSYHCDVDGATDGLLRLAHAMLKLV